jgi:hypothetical protein
MLYKFLIYFKRFLRHKSSLFFYFNNIRIYNNVFIFLLKIKFKYKTFNSLRLKNGFIRFILSLYLLIYSFLSFIQTIIIK